MYTINVKACIYVICFFLNNTLIPYHEKYQSLKMLNIISGNDLMI